ncbi:MAG: glycosyltransferase, partial [Firmicutes bacterium]|nr:glycosyltransferase [Bacillota bacterium]
GALARGLVACGRLRQARAALKVALRDAHDRELLFLAGSTAAAIGNHGEAITFLRRALAAGDAVGLDSALVPTQQSAALYYMGGAEHRLLRTRSARTLLAQAHEVATAAQLPAVDVAVIEAGLAVVDKTAARAPVRSVQRRSQTARQPAILWESSLFNMSGYACGSRDIVQGLDELGCTLQVIVREEQSRPELCEPARRERLLRMMARQLSHIDVHVQMFTPAEARLPQVPASVLRTMYEADGLPEDWVHSCNQFARVFVAAPFNVDTFARAGVDPEKLRVVPEPFDFSYFQRSGNADRARNALPPLRSFVFLSIFDWNFRKGWDILLEAFARAFDRDDDVTLLIKTSSFDGAQIESAIAELWKRLGVDPAALPHIVLRREFMADEQIRDLYEVADAFVLPTRGEGWGRPYLEAMAMEVPVIATAWGGNLAFLNSDRAYMIDINGLEAIDERMHMRHYRGLRWAAPSVESTAAQMRRAHREVRWAKERARALRPELQAVYNAGAVAELWVEEIRRLEEDL